MPLPPNPYLTKDHVALLDHFWSGYKQALRFGTIRNLLPDGITNDRIGVP